MEWKDDEEYGWEVVHFQLLIDFKMNDPPGGQDDVGSAKRRAVLLLLREWGSRRGQLSAGRLPSRRRIQDLLRRGLPAAPVRRLRLPARGNLAAFRRVVQADVVCPQKMGEHTLGEVREKSEAYLRKKNQKTSSPQNG